MLTGPPRKFHGTRDILMRGSAVILMMPNDKSRFCLKRWYAVCFST